MHEQIILKSTSKFKVVEAGIKQILPVLFDFRFWQNRDDPFKIRQWREREVKIKIEMAEIN